MKRAGIEGLIGNSFPSVCYFVLKCLCKWCWFYVDLELDMLNGKESCIVKVDDVKVNWIETYLQEFFADINRYGI